MNESGFSDNVLIGDVLRLYENKHPGGLMKWRKQNAWVRLINWYWIPGVRKPANLDLAIIELIRSGINRSGSMNPWSVSRRSTRKSLRGRDGSSLSFRIAEYSIGRVCTREEQLKWER